MESFLADLLCALTARGVTTSALVHGGPGRQSQWEGIAPRILRAPSYGRLLYAPVSPTFPIYLERAIRESEAEVLHIHMPNPSAFWLLSSHEARCLPWVIHWHADVLTEMSTWSLKMAYRLYSKLEAAMLKRACVIIASSPNYLQSSNPLAPYQDKARVIPLGIDINRLPGPGAEECQLARECWPPEIELKILMVGRFTYYKGHAPLLRALSRVPKAAVVMAGVGEKQGEMERLAAHLGLGRRAYFAGGVDEKKLAALYKTADVLCLPAIDRAEAFGMVLLEGMRYEKALIASNIRGSGVPWVIDQCGCGLLVEPGDIDGLASALNKLIDDPPALLKMSFMAAQAFQLRFRIEPVADRIENLYHEILAGP